MGEPREIAVGAGRIDDHEVVGALDRADRLRKASEFDRLVLVELELRAACDAEMHRHLQVDAGAPGPGPAVLDVVGEALLPGVEVDGRHPLPDGQQGNGYMHRGGRLAGAALLVTEHDDMRGRRSPSGPLN
jgi:hypothetical protein